MMEAFLIDSKSWHFIFAERGTSTNLESKMSSYRYGTEGYSLIDICSYTRYVLLGVLLTFFYYAIAGAFITSAGFALLALYYQIAPSWHAFPAMLVAMFASAVLAIVGILYSVAWIGDHWPNELLNKVSAPGFAIQAYSSWKGKYCVPLKLKVEVVNED